MPNTFTSYAHLQSRLKPALSVDEDVLKVLNFMKTSHESHIEASRLVAVAEQVALLAPLLWGHHERKEVCYPSLITNKIVTIDRFDEKTYKKVLEVIKDCHKEDREDANLHHLQDC